MSKCPTVHEAPEFTSSYDPTNKNEKYQYDKLKKYLASDCAEVAGEQLKYDLWPFRSFPQGGVALRILFMLCSQCNGNALESKKCGFCLGQGHTMKDAVLFFIGDDHRQAYLKTGLKIARSYQKE